MQLQLWNSQTKPNKTEGTLVLCKRCQLAIGNVIADDKLVQV